MDYTQKPSLTAISVGPGILGIERGVERIARLNHIAYVEIEAFIIENLVAQMERGLLDPAVIWSDVKTLPCKPFRGIVDIIFAGYPCQPFSNAGKRRGVEDPRHLYPYIERAIDIIRPRICFFENVRGHVSCGLLKVIESLEGLGYTVRWGIFSAEETGASHKRERVFILAVENSDNGRFIRSRICKEQSWRTEAISASKMADSHEQYDDGGWNSRSERRDEFTNCGELADASSICEREQNNQTSTESWQDSRESVSGGSSQLGYTNDSRLQGWIRKECDERSGQWSSRKNGSQRMVSRPGEPQQTWEHPRVISREIESSVGVSAHGYNFREDLLRALGNSVYADTAELAFRTLINKL